MRMQPVIIPMNVTLLSKLHLDVSSNLATTKTPDIRPLHANRRTRSHIIQFSIQSLMTGMSWILSSDPDICRPFIKVSPQTKQLGHQASFPLTLVLQAGQSTGACGRRTGQRFRTVSCGLQGSKAHLLAQWRLSPALRLTALSLDCNTFLFFAYEEQRRRR